MLLVWKKIGKNTISYNLGRLVQHVSYPLNLKKHLCYMFGIVLTLKLLLFGGDMFILLSFDVLETSRTHG